MILFNGLRKIILSYAWLSWRADTQSLSQFPCDIATHEWLHLTGNLTLADLCVEFGGGNETVSEHLTDGFYRQAVLQADSCRKGMSCRMRGGFGMRWESCLDDDVPYLAVEMAIRGELTKEQTLLLSVADNGEYLFGNGQ